MTARPIAVDPRLLMWLVVRIADLTDLLAMARETVVREQAEHAAYRAANPVRRRPAA